jgi:hypothetical protein
VEPRARGERFHPVGDNRQRFDLRREEKVVVSPTDIQRLDADGVPRHEEVLAVGDGEREHAIQIGRTLRALLTVQCERGLAVAIGLKAIPSS